MINSFLQKLSTWVTAKWNISTRIDFLLLISVTFLRAALMCSAFTADFGYDNSTITLIGDVYCPKTKCLGKLCLHKKTFQSLGRSDFQCPQCASVCQVRNITFEKQTNSFFLSLGQGVYIFEESPKSYQVVIGDVYCSPEFCLSREKCKSNGGYTKYLRSIYGCDKCGAWLFVHKVPFTLQEHVNTTKTDKTRFFFPRKRWTCYTTNSCSKKSLFNQTNIGRKNCVYTTSRLLELCIVPHAETKSLFTFQPIKWLVPTTVKSVRHAATFWKFLLRTRNQQLCCLAVMEHRVYTIRDYEQPSPFLKNILRQSQSLTPKKGKSSANMGQMYPFPIGWWFEPQIQFSKSFVQFQSTVNLHPTYTKPSWSSQSPTTESSGLSILDPTL